MAEKTVNMKVFGMTCDDCALTVTRGLKGKDGVLDVRVSLADKSAVVRIDEGRVKPSELEVLPIFSGKSQYRAQLRE
ncbi:MAG: heavy-metal-associated domain-containing protein [Nitrososphaerota archaeon]|jgi:copper chaperone CopZ|nr:heavy-metal-associated domain-containing protein [Nitrososphaerota archaeon]MDG7039380.1 heavy-metal-associated domain-containing protein [Nitrososphaerota archaeon]